MQGEGAQLPGVPASRVYGRESTPPLPGLARPEGRLSGVHVPSGLNGDKVDPEGRCWGVYVCVHHACTYMCVFLVCVMCVVACVRMSVLCVCVRVCSVRVCAVCMCVHMCVVCVCAHECLLCVQCVHVPACVPSVSLALRLRTPGAVWRPPSRRAEPAGPHLGMESWWQRPRVESSAPTSSPRSPGRRRAGRVGRSWPSLLACPSG